MYDLDTKRSGNNIMSKILITDHLGSHRTTQQIEKWFAAKGHEVKWSMYYEPEMMDWCDVTLFAWTEGMLQLALKDGWGKKRKIVTYAMDIEIWSGQPVDTDWSQVDTLAYCSKFMFDLLKERYPIGNVKTAHIPLSVDMGDWSYEKREPGRKIAVLGHMWPAKGADMIPQFAKHLIQMSGKDTWQIYVQGEWRHDVWEWYYYYVKGMIKDLGLENNVFINEEHIPSVNEWLEDKNYFVHFGQKDAFSIGIAEAMAKGLKALPHNFPGAEDIWGDYVWKTIPEAVNKILVDPYKSEEYRDYVDKKYSNEVIMPLWEKILL